MLGEKYAAQAVDMETATVARLCNQHGVPFRCLRAISDEMDTALSPRLISLLFGGRVSPLRLLAVLAASPRLIKELLRLARHTRLAGQQLDKALGQVLLELSSSNQPKEKDYPATS
jgi:adenosylhomocysteine nucleosidase